MFYSCPKDVIEKRARFTAHAKTDGCKLVRIDRNVPEYLTDVSNCQVTAFTCIVDQLQLSSLLCIYNKSIYNCILCTVPADAWIDSLDNNL